MSTPAQSRRAADALAILAATGDTAFTSADLDAAGIGHWRERIAAAVDQDEREQGRRYGRNYDLLMTNLRAELGRVALPVPPAPDVRPPQERLEYRNYTEPQEEEEPF